MQKIFWIGSPFFHASLIPLGFHVHYFNFEHVAVFGYADLVRMAGFEPDIVIVADKSRPPFVLGIEDFPCFTILYAVDTHIHSWLPFYAQAFDACLISLKDHIPLFQQKALAKEHILWSPPFARDTDLPPAKLLDYISTQHETSYEYNWDCLFVGTINAETTPTRKIFLEQLQKETSIHITRGNFAQLFPQGRVIINHCEHGDLNFRVFEALACGSALVTPTLAHGFFDIFTDQKHLLCYDKENTQDAINKINYLQENETVRRSLARQGFELIHGAHRAQHRAQALTHFLHSLSPTKKQEHIRSRLKNAAHIRKHWLKAPYLLLADSLPPSHDLRNAYLQAALGNFDG